MTKCEGLKQSLYIIKKLKIGKFSSIDLIKAIIKSLKQSLYITKKIKNC